MGDSQVLCFHFRSHISVCSSTVADFAGAYVSYEIKATVDPAGKHHRPVWSDYGAKWYKTYVQPIFDNINNEYSCRVDETKRSIEHVLSIVFSPLSNLYILLITIKRRLVDVPYRLYSSSTSDYQLNPNLVRDSKNYLRQEISRL